MADTMWVMPSARRVDELSAALISERYSRGMTSVGGKVGGYRVPK